MARASALRASILVAMGIVPLACGGTTLSRGDEDDDVGGGGTAGSGGPGLPNGSGGTAGTKPITGYPAAGAGGSRPVPQVGGGGRAPAGLCTSPSFDPATGLVSCLEGYSHRVQVVACEGAFGGAPSYGGERAEGGDGPVLACPSGNLLEPCVALPFAYCERVEGLGSYCASGCQTDQDCGRGYLCECGHPESPTGGACRPSDCRTDADCGPQLLCASYAGTCGETGFACQTPVDECTTSKDCGGSACEPYGDDSVPNVVRRQCSDAVCGRPFLVDSIARVAGVTTNTDWCSPRGALPRVEHLSASERAALAAHWTRMGQMEHASIAAFARFSLQLLALGAPPELVSACTRALSDETAHTQLCFQLASAYAGRNIGPGPLDVSGSLDVSSLGEIVDLVIAEGCFGETVAALEALDAADSASDPVIAAAYAQIGRDEQRHAELAFRFLRWALERNSHLVRKRVLSAVGACFDGDSAARDVVVPCLLALLRAEAQLSEATA